MLPTNVIKTEETQSDIMNAEASVPDFWILIIFAVARQCFWDKFGRIYLSDWRPENSLKEAEFIYQGDGSNLIQWSQSFRFLWPDVPIISPRLFRALKKKRKNLGKTQWSSHSWSWLCLENVKNLPVCEPVVSSSRIIIFSGLLTRPGTIKQRVG